MAIFTLAISATALIMASDTPTITPEVRALHERVLTLDTHVDIGRNYATYLLDPGQMTSAQVDLPKMRAGGLDAAFFIIYTGQGPLDEQGLADARAHAEESYQAIDRMIRAYPDQIALARSADEIEAIHASGRKVALIGIENPYPLGLSVDDVPMWAARGVRYISMTHFGNNQFGGSSNPNLAAGDLPEDTGLTSLGRDLVRALNDYGIMVDVSHGGPTTMRQAAELSRAPIIASHSGVKAVLDHPRNLSDEQLEIIRDVNGVAQMVALRSYVKANHPELASAQEAVLAEMGLETREARAAISDQQRFELMTRLEALHEQYGSATISDFVDHIDHAAQVAGIDHVGIASDFDGGGGVGGWMNAAETPAVTAELVRRGYSEADIAKIWGGNLMRVMRDVEAAARD